MSLDEKLLKIRSPNLESQKHVSKLSRILSQPYELTVADCSRTFVDRGYLV